MARFITVQKLPVVATQDDVIEAGRAMASAPSLEAVWLRGWIVPGGDCLVSEWEAPEQDAIGAALRQTTLLPVEGIYPATTIDPAWFRA